ncbi:MAG TPA: hypothetical protein VIY47_03535, partial [Ignavibacteriaceae bacterium]
MEQQPQDQVPESTELQHQEPKENPAPTDLSKELFDKYRGDAQKFQAELKAKEAELEAIKMAKLKESKNWQEI